MAGRAKQSLGRVGVRPAALIDRLLKRVEFDTNGGCWLYTGALDGWGYGFIHSGNLSDDIFPRMARTHRVAYHYLRGPIQDGMTIDHLCRVRCCCNPDHLEVVTQKENTMRGTSFGAKNAIKTHCVNGHDLSNAHVDKSGYRHCVVCGRERQRKYLGITPDKYRKR